MAAQSTQRSSAGVRPYCSHASRNLFGASSSPAGFRSRTNSSKPTVSLAPEADDGLRVELELIGPQRRAELGRRKRLACRGGRQVGGRLDGRAARAALGLRALARELGRCQHVRQALGLRTDDRADAHGDGQRLAVVQIPELPRRVEDRRADRARVRKVAAGERYREPVAAYAAHESVTAGNALDLATRRAESPRRRHSNRTPR